MNDALLDFSSDILINRILIGVCITDGKLQLAIIHSVPAHLDAAFAIQFDVV